MEIFKIVEEIPAATNNDFSIVLSLQDPTGFPVRCHKNSLKKLIGGNIAKSNWDNKSNQLVVEIECVLYCTHRTSKCTVSEDSTLSIDIIHLIHKFDSCKLPLGNFASSRRKRKRSLENLLDTICRWLLAWIQLSLLRFRRTTFEVLPNLNIRNLDTRIKCFEEMRYLRIGSAPAWVFTCCQHACRGAWKGYLNNLAPYLI